MVVVSQNGLGPACYSCWTTWLDETPGDERKTSWDWGGGSTLKMDLGDKRFFRATKSRLTKKVIWWQSLFMYIIKITRWLFKDTRTTLLTVPQWDLVIILWLNTCRQAFMLWCNFLTVRYFLKGIIHNRVYDGN